MFSAKSFLVCLWCLHYRRMGKKQSNINCCFEQRNDNETQFGHKKTFFFHHENFKTASVAQKAYHFNEFHWASVCVLFALETAALHRGCLCFCLFPVRIENENFNVNIPSNVCIQRVVIGTLCVCTCMFFIFTASVHTKAVNSLKKNTYTHVTVTTAKRIFQVKCLRRC